MRTAPFLKADPAPWDTLSKGHFVARCSYITTNRESSQITTCPDGQSYDLTPPLQIIVDQEGRSTPDFGGVRRPVAPC